MEALNGIWWNYCIIDAFGPGYTFKPFVVAAALEEGKSLETYMCDGAEVVSGVRMRCVNRSGHGEITLGQTIMYSCNDALVQIGLAIGRSDFYKYEKMFNFGGKTGIDLPGEGTGILHKEEGLNPVELSTSSFGQTQTVTMVQMLAAFSSVINGGYYYEPHVVNKRSEDHTS